VLGLQVLPHPSHLRIWKNGVLVCISLVTGRLPISLDMIASSISTVHSWAVFVPCFLFLAQSFPVSYAILAPFPQDKIETLIFSRVLVTGSRMIYFGMRKLAPKGWLTLEVSKALTIHSLNPVTTDNNLAMLNTGMCSDKCILRQVRCCANAMIYLHKPRQLWCH
jgi:hypothetical protein